MKMRRKIVYILVCMLVFTTFAGAISSTNTSTKSNDDEPANRAYSHSILGEYFTMTTCVPCKYTHQALKNLYAGGYHPFYYITYVYNKGTVAMERKVELNVIASPSVVWDGDFRRDVGGTSTQIEMGRQNTSIIACGNRNVKDIDLSLDVEWLGAVNNEPEDGATDVIVEKIMNWTISEMDIDVSITNNEASQYNGHLHVYVTEVNSTWYNDKFGNPYTFEFKNYAFNEDKTLSAGATWDDSIGWDGLDYTNGTHNFEHITQDNIMVIAAVFDEDNADYVDETAGFRTGIGTDPKKFNIFFGNITPPPNVMENVSLTSFVSMEGYLEFNTTYYWKIDVWDGLDNPTYGDIWNFTTRGNSPPNESRIPIPPDNYTGIRINTNLSWTCEDPDGDDILYDVYLSEGESNPMLVAEDLNVTVYDPVGSLKFDTAYVWKVVAKDEYHLYKPDWIYNTTGPNWTFVTEPNEAPYPASNPFPGNGVNNVPVDAILNWTGTDPNLGDFLFYDVYFGVTNPPTKKSSNQTGNSYDPFGDMELFKTYYWYIVTWDSQGLSTYGDIWSFTTGVNHEPDAPTIDGETQGTAGEEYEYTFISEDQDGDNVSYYIEWRDPDGNITDWTPFQTQGSPGYKESHSWPDGTYTIRAKAKDIWGDVSAWGYLEVTHPKSKQSASMMFYQFLQELIQRFPLLEKVFLLFPVFNRIMNLQ